jgi:hypothetical protein
LDEILYPLSPKRHPNDMGAPEVQAFLTDLAVKHVGDLNVVPVLEASAK